MHHSCFPYCRKPKTLITSMSSLPVYPLPHPPPTCSTPPSDNAALSSLACPPAQFEDKQWSESSEQLDEDRKDTLTSSFSTSILSILHLHPTTPPSGHLHITATDTAEIAPDVSELWVTGIGIHEPLFCLTSSAFVEKSIKQHTLMLFFCLNVSKLLKRLT